MTDASTRPAAAQTPNTFVLKRAVPIPSLNLTQSLQALNSSEIQAARAQAQYQIAIAELEATKLDRKIRSTIKSLKLVCIKFD